MPISISSKLKKKNFFLFIKKKKKNLNKKYILITHKKDCLFIY
jgi:hypothetical protein